MAGQGSVGERTLAYLVELGRPEYGAAIAKALDARASAVAGALSRLAGRGALRVAYTKPAASGGREAIFYEPAPVPEGELLDRYKLDARLLRAEYGPVEVEALIASNRPVAGL